MTEPTYADALTRLAPLAETVMGETRRAAGKPGPQATLRALAGHWSRMAPSERRKLLLTARARLAVGSEANDPTKQAALDAYRSVLDDILDAQVASP